ncbi:MAG: DNA recombination protein RmuC [Bacteroidales bacterium]|nr:DNA recombination protein RmuC [Bacteroidales bacterium]
MTDILLGILVMLAIVNVVFALINRKSHDSGAQLKEVEKSILKFQTVLEKSERTVKDEFERNRRESQESAKANREELTRALQSFEEKFASNIRELNELIRQKFGDFNKQQIDNNKLATDHMKGIQETIEKQLTSIRDDNARQLTEMRLTVDEKLQTTLEKRLGESFKQVSERLEQVHKGLGEMQTIASGVGDLKKVLSNVKTRGVLGEYQLGNILEQILTPEQYSLNVATKKGSQAHVEFAIKLPGKSSDEEVWLPVDSKFPIETFELLLAAYDQGNTEQIEAAQKILIKSVEGFAKEISEKYLDPPHTTDFGIMFLPVESLYAEVLRHPGLFENLQRNHRITVTGPTTLSALLNSLQMGFRTLAVQKRSSEVWKVLGAVKAEFVTFSEHLKKVRKQLETATGTLDRLQTTRTSQMEKKLRTVETLDTPASREVLELPSESEEEYPEVE